jgi:hypothetical protein
MHAGHGTHAHRGMLGARRVGAHLSFTRAREDATADMGLQVKKREEYFLNTIRLWQSIGDDRIFGIGEAPDDFLGVQQRGRYLVTQRWVLNYDEYNNVLNSRRELIALKRSREGGSYTRIMPKRLLDLLKMSVFPEVI